MGTQGKVVDEPGATARSATISTCGTFRYALARRWDPTLPTVMFVGLNPSNLDFYAEAKGVEYELIRNIMMMVSPFEVRARASGEWEDLILQAFSVWRPLMENRGGAFVGRSDERRVWYEPLPA